METSCMQVSYPLDAVYQETHQELEMKTHFHNSYEMIYILEGKAQFRINNRTYDAGSNSIIFISNLETHELKVTGYPYVRYFILIRPDYFQSVIKDPMLSSIFKHRPNHFDHVITLEPGSCESILGIIKAIHEEMENKNDFWETSVKSNLHLLFVSIYRKYKNCFPVTKLNKSTNMILDIQRYMEEHCREELSLVDISNMFYTDMYYLSHTFKKVTGFTFRDYLILQRISMAKDRLFYTDENITQVCINSGFNNVNHFIRIFRKFEGITPYQYRKKNKA